MISTTPSGLMTIWDQANNLHPIDRNLLMVGYTRPDIPATLLADLPLSSLNKILLGMRLGLFGHRMITMADCSHCQQTLELPLDLAEILKQFDVTNSTELSTIFLEYQGYRFRSPTSRDLAVISADASTDSAFHLFHRCCVNLSDLSAEDDSMTQEQLMGQVAELMDEFDPATNISFDIVCQYCGEHDEVTLDIGDFLWREIDSYVRSLLFEIHTLASAYGWSEQAILELNPRSRQHYMNMVMT